MLLGLIAIAGSPDAMTHVAAEVIGDNKAYIAGRVGTGMLVTAGLGRIGGPTGARTGFALAGLAAIGDASHALRELDERIGGRPCTEGGL
jgi:hypothetical protein